MALSPAGRWCALSAAILVAGAGCGDRSRIEDGVAAAAPLEADAERPVFDLGVTPTLPLGAGTIAMVTGDFDGDGKLDLAAACPSAGVIVVLGRGGGAFGPARTFVTESAPQGIVAADFDGDGKLDLAVADAGGASVLRGHGDGTFERPRRFAVGGSPIAIATGDFDGDGKQDLATGAADGQVSLLRGNGDGTFQPARDYATVRALSTLLAADFDGDGRPDLFAASRTRQLVLLAKRDGTLLPTQVIDTPDRGSSSSLAFAVADLDGDGKADRVEGYKDVDERWAVVSLGNGDGTFHSRWTMSLDHSRSPRAIVAGDLDGDGIPDLAFGFARTVLVVRGNGDGTFHGEDYFGIQGMPGALAAADLDGDGVLDLVAASAEQRDLSVLFGHGDGTFRGERAFLVAPGPARVATGDFDGDGSPDAFVTSSDDRDEYTVLLGDGRGELRKASGGLLGSAHGDVVTADLDGDGKLDVVSAARWVLLGNGDGTFREVPRPPWAPPPLGVAPWSQSEGKSLAVSDLDGDGKLDLALITAQARGVVLLFGKGDGTFQPDRTIILGTVTRAVAAADLDGDGKQDLAVSSDRGLLLLFGKGDGTFEPALDSGQVSKPGRLVAADVDGDGRIDLVVEDGDRGGTSALLNAGERRFVRAGTVTATGRIALADVDGDGRIDLVIGSQPIVSPPIAFFLGNGDGTFRQAARSFAIVGRDFAPADLDHDGLPDLLFVDKGPFLRLARNTTR